MVTSSNENSDPGMRGALLRMKAIVKDFPGTRALDAVDFEVRPGEVHALIGENGAGKSTLMNVLAGRFGDYAGVVHFRGRSVRLTNPRQAHGLGIAVIHQDLNVLGNLTVAENIMLGQEPRGRLPGTLDRGRLRAEAHDALRHLGFRLPLDAPVNQLGTAHQQMVAIAQAIRRDVRLLVFDEPTASLGQHEVEQLFIVMCELKSKGIGIVYITHRLAELGKIADRVSVLRDGRMVGTRRMSKTQLPELTRMMLGRELAEMFPQKRNTPGPVVLKVRNLTRPGAFEDVSFDLRAGEILGIAGLVGSGRTEIVRALFGADKAAGRCELRGREIRRSPRRCKAAGIGMIPEGRKVDGNITGLTVAQNLNIGLLDRLSGAMALLTPRRMRNQAAIMTEQMRIVPPDPSRSIDQLSGGNQQKVIVGRWLALTPDVFIFDEPTQGIDVGTKAQMYRLIMELACEGRGVILISSEFIELVNLADRILVVREGRLTGELSAGDLDEDAVFEACGSRD